MSDFLNALTYNSIHPLQFNSVLFFILFTFLYIIYSAVYQKVSVRNILLLIFSLYFYFKVSGLAVVVLLFIATSDFFIGKGIFYSQKKSLKTFLLLLSLIINLGSLFYFKYTNFFLKLYGDVQGTDPLVLNIIMPIGISFFVFKTLSYIFDIYRGNIEKPETNYFNYVLYVAFFPSILAGPISRASDLLPQFREKFQINRTNLGQGLFLIMSGAFKKIFIADFLAGNFVDRVFDAPDYFSGFESLMAGYGYTIQLYFDFSGYTDMVVGIACLLGFAILPNFNKPFLAVNITDFWRRWHLTLSSWLRDYLFIPLSLGMRNIKTTGLVIAILITFILCGFWHGANLTFIIWGGLHAVAMAWDIITNKVRGKIKKKVNKGVYKFISIFITFHFLCLSFIIFRAADFATAMKIYTKIFSDMNFNLFIPWLNLYLYPFLILVLGLVLHFTPMKWNYILLNKFTRLHWTLKIAVVFIAFIVIYQVFSTQSQPFLYLEF
jgi:alginate O-acetyltransferase complex protein AlgI